MRELGRERVRVRERARERERTRESHGVDDTQLTCQAGRRRTSSGVAAAHIGSSNVMVIQIRM